MARFPTGPTQYFLLVAGVAVFALNLPSPAWLLAATEQFRGVNWADQRDNFVPDALVLGGLDTADPYKVTRAKAAKILGGFQHDLGANTVRLPVNYPTVAGSYWSSYTGVVDEATHRGMNTVLSYWESSESKDGKVDDLTQFWTLWDIIVGKYQRDSHVYFEPMNEPHGYSATEWTALAADWVARYPTVPRSRMIISGVGYNQEGTPIGADPRLADCLISIHLYGFWYPKRTTEEEWRDALTASIGPYASRTLVSEFGAPMATGLNYNGAVGGEAGYFIAFLRGVSSRARELGVGTIYWPGLRVGDPYSLETLHGSGTHLSLTINNKTGRDRLQASWGR